jgi:serine/threonine protein phosphatase PrpC
MATTLVAALIRGRNAVFAHTGDSRAYIIGSEGIRFRTRDHSVVESLIERGEIRPCDAPTHPFRNILTRCIGASFKVDISSHRIEESDVVLLCTDGFYGVVGEEGMRSCIGRGGAMEVVDCLSGKARDGATDNVTLAAWTPLS